MDKELAQEGWIHVRTIYDWLMEKWDLVEQLPDHLNHDDQIRLKVRLQLLRLFMEGIKYDAEKEDADAESSLA